MHNSISKRVLHLFLVGVVGSFLACGEVSTVSQVEDIPSPAARLEGQSPAELRTQRSARFLQTYAPGLIVVIAQSELAQTQSEDPLVRQLADSIFVASRQLYNQAVQLAREKGFSIPGQVSDTQYRAVTRLEAMRGERFTNEYLDAMEDYHEELIQDLDALPMTQALIELNATMRSVADKHLTKVQQLKRDRLLRPEQ